MTNTSLPVPTRPASFATPVRGSRFQPRPSGAADPRRGRLTLRREPGNPADPLAVAVWVDGPGVPWRLGYLERAVAARVAARLDAVGSADLPAAWSGTVEEPRGRWTRPEVRVGAQHGEAADAPGSLRRLPPYRRMHSGPVRTPGVARRTAQSDGAADSVVSGSG